MKTSKILENAAFAAMVPGIWTQQAYAKNNENKEVDTSNPSACKFCVFGMLQATLKIQDSDISMDYMRARKALQKQVGLFPSDWNDEIVKSQKEIAEALWLAAETMKAQGD